MTGAVAEALSPGQSEETAERSWRALYILGAVVAFVALAGTVFDIVLTMVPGWGVSTVPTEAHLWFRQFEANPLLGLRNLDLLNITLSAVSLPLYVAIYGALRRTRPALALLALILVSLGTAVFIASNAALPMLELSRRYALAPTPARRQALEVAAEALLARGAHASFGAFPGFLVSEIGTLLMAASMLGTRVFGRVTGGLGVAGASVLVVYSVAYTFAPEATGLVMAVALPGGLMMMTWNVLVARTLLRLARGARALA